MSHDTMSDDELLEQLRPAFYTVAIYKVDREYGGPEEGGWWYDCGERVDFPIDGLPENTVLPRIFTSEDAAYAYARAINQQLAETVNVGRPSIGSVLSRGRYAAEVHDTYPPATYPETRPYYE